MQDRYPLQQGPKTFFSRLSAAVRNVYTIVQLLFLRLAVMPWERKSFEKAVGKNDGLFVLGFRVESYPSIHPSIQSCLAVRAREIIALDGLKEEEKFCRKTNVSVSHAVEVVVVVDDYKALPGCAIIGRFFMKVWEIAKPGWLAGKEVEVGKEKNIDIFIVRYNTRTRPKCKQIFKIYLNRYHQLYSYKVEETDTKMYIVHICIVCNISNHGNDGKTTAISFLYLLPICMLWPRSASGVTVWITQEI